MVDPAWAKPPALSFSLVDPEPHQADLGRGKKRFTTKHKTRHVAAGRVKGNLSLGVLGFCLCVWLWSPLPTWGTRVEGRLISCQSNSSPFQEFCCFVPSSREWAQMKLKQVLIKTRSILQNWAFNYCKYMSRKVAKGKKNSNFLCYLPFSLDYHHTFL